MTEPHTITVDTDVASTTAPPASAPIPIVTWNTEVNSTVAASVAFGADRADPYL